MVDVLRLHCIIIQHGCPTGHTGRKDTDMTIYDFITAHPDNHIRIVRYIPAPDIIDEYGIPSYGGEGESTVMFDSMTGEGDLSPDLLLMEVINSVEPEEVDGSDIYELEYMPDEYWL